MLCVFFFFFKQKTAYEMRISDWSSDVCSSDLGSCERALDALQLQYPDYAGALEERFLRQAALRLEEAEYAELLADSVIGQEVHADLGHRLRIELQAVRSRPPLDLGLRTADLVRQLGRASCRERVCQYG